MVALILWLGCPQPSGFDRALEALRAGDRPAVEAAIAAEPDPVARDVMRARLATENPKEGGFLCAQMTTAEGRAKCDRLLGRPHLNAAPP